MPVLVQIMAWCQIDDRLLSEAIMECFTDTYQHHSASMSFKHIEVWLKWWACGRSYCQYDPLESLQRNFNQNGKIIIQEHTFEIDAFCSGLHVLTHWGRVMHIFISKFTIIGSDNGLSPVRHQAIIWTKDEILLIRTLGTNFSEILSKIHTLSFKNMHLKMSVKWRKFFLSLNVSRQRRTIIFISFISLVILC